MSVRRSIRVQVWHVGVLRFGQRARGDLGFGQNVSYVADIRRLRIFLSVKSVSIKSQPNCSFQQKSEILMKQCLVL